MNKFINIYIKASKAYLVPHSEGNDSGMVENFPVIEVNDVTDNDQVWAALNEALIKCNEPIISRSADTVLECYFGIKGFKKTYQDITLIGFRDIEDYRILLYPHKKGSNCFIGLKPIEIGTLLIKEKFLSAFTRIMNDTV